MIDAPTTSITVPADPAFLQQLATMLERRAEWRSRASVLGALLELEPLNWRARLKLYETWRSAGEPGRADAALQEMLDLALARSGGVGTMQRLFEASGHREALLRLYQELYARKPDDGRTALQYAMLLEDTGEIDSAKDLVATLLGRPGRASSARRALVMKLADHGRQALVEAAISGWLEADAAGATALVGDGQVLRHADLLLRAIQRLDAGTPEVLRLQLGLLKVLDDGGRGDIAEPAYRALEPGMSIQPAPTQASPTASTLMYRNRPLLRCLVEVASWVVELRGNASIHVGGCSTGEEAFSLAIALAERGLLGKCAVSASDVDPELVERAAAGVLDARSVTEMPRDLVGKYLAQRADGRFDLDQGILRAIGFDTLDLGSDAASAAPFDLLVANNILVHFPDSDARAMVAHMVTHLKPDGILCIGGGRQDRLEPVLNAQGLMPVTALASEVHEAWRLQRSAWYSNPRPYWALPPASWTAATPWRHTTLFALSAEVAGRLEAHLSRTAGDESR